MNSVNLGDLESMATLPVASAISRSGIFSVFGSALTRAGLAKPLDEAPELTVFAPLNTAFLKIPPERLRAVSEDPKALTRMVRQHVVSGRLSSQNLPGTHATLGGGRVTVQSRGADMTVNGTAKVICAEVQTTNATVYVVDAVLEIPRTEQ